MFPSLCCFGAIQSSRPDADKENVGSQLRKRVVGSDRPLGAKAVFSRSRSSEFNVVPQREEILAFIKETICHLAPVDLLHIYAKHDVELTAEI